MKKFILSKTYFPKEFWILVIIKLFIGTLFASHYVTKGFLPFLNHFISVGQNPYDYFYRTSNIVFPYPAGMLLILDPFLRIGNLLTTNFFTHINLELFVFRIPILIADIIIYFVLCKLLPSKEKKVLWLYFASPILFYINYIHGQLDVIPTAFLIVSLYFLSLKKYVHSFLILGAGIAVKTHLLIAVPFYLVYLLRKKVKLIEIGKILIPTILIFFAVNIPFASREFLLTVFNNAEQQRLFFTVFSYQYKELSLLIAPAALLICFYIFASNRKLNFDSLILMLGLVFTILIALVPPMQGWFYWSIPLFIYFIIKYKDSPPLSFILMNIFFIAFFVFAKDSDVIESASATFKSLEGTPNLYMFLGSKGFDVERLQNILFTCLQISVAVNAYWCYKLGIYYNNLYIERQKPFILGIGGDSGVGKSTLGDEIRSLVGLSQAVILNGDDSHKWERADNNWQVFTHLNPKANEIHKDVEHMYALVDGRTIERVNYDHKNGKFTKPVKVEKNQFIIFQGLHPFFLEKMREIYDLKIFIDADEKLRKKWKIERDTKLRGRNAQNVKMEISKRKKDSAKFIAPQKKLSDWVISYYMKKETIFVTYTFRNSIPLEKLLSEFKKIATLKVEHDYIKTDIQTVTVEGKISKKNIAKIAYLLFPNLNELLNNQPKFNDNSEGVNQLFFLNYLNYHLVRNKSNIVNNPENKFI